MKLDPEFVDDCPYGPGGLLIDEILEIDREAGRVLLRMPTHEDLPITREQRVHATRHPRHVSGGLMIHMTGVVGMVHAHYVLGLRHRDGWTGYGARINSARFHSLGKMGPPLLLEGVATQVRRGAKQIYTRYLLKFTQEDKLVYEGDQVAMFFRVDDGDGPLAESK